MDLNAVTLSGNLTRDPELRTTPGGTSVASLRIASNRRVKDGGSGEWKDVAGYFDVSVWGGRGEFVADKLSKGDKVFLTGRLEWREWQAQDGSNRQSIGITAENIESPNFFGNRTPSSDPTGERPPAADSFPTAAADDDIPF